MQSMNVSNMLNDDIEILFAHPEALLSKEGRELMSSEQFQKKCSRMCRGRSPLC